MKWFLCVVKTFKSSFSCMQVYVTPSSGSRKMSILWQEILFSLTWPLFSLVYVSFKIAYRVNLHSTLCLFCISLSMMPQNPSLLPQWQNLLLSHTGVTFLIRSTFLYPFICDVRKVVSMFCLLSNASMNVRIQISTGKYWLHFLGMYTQVWYCWVMW